jgi:hypothetical protein
VSELNFLNSKLKLDERKYRKLPKKTLDVFTMDVSFYHSSTQATIFDLCNKLVESCNKLVKYINFKEKSIKYPCFSIEFFRKLKNAAFLKT